MVCDLPLANPCATGLGLKLSLAIAFSTAAFFSALTLAVPFSMRDTVLGETPASRATISSVEGAESNSLSNFKMHLPFYIFF
jgi:hypothetical protein